MRHLLGQVKTFNAYLSANLIMNLALYPEFLACFQAICEMGRHLNDTCPPSMKGAWLCFAYWTADDGKSNEVVIKVKLDGPVGDRNIFNPVYGRDQTFKDYRKQLSRRIEKGNIHFYSKCDWDSMTRDQLASTAKKMQADLVNFRDITEGNLQYLENLETASLEELLDGIRDGGRDWKLKQFIRFYKDIQQDLVIINQKGEMCSADMIDGEVVEVDPPSWLDKWVLFDEGRRVTYGDRSLNGTIERHTLRNKYKLEAKQQKKTLQNARYAKKKRESGHDYRDNRDNRPDRFDRRERYDDEFDGREDRERSDNEERERSPPRKRHWRDNNNEGGGRGRPYKQRWN